MRRFGRHAGRRFGAMVAKVDRCLVYFVRSFVCCFTLLLSRYFGTVCIGVSCFFFVFVCFTFLLASRNGRNVTLDAFG